MVLCLCSGFQVHGLHVHHKVRHTEDTQEGNLAWGSRVFPKMKVVHQKLKLHLSRHFTLYVRVLADYGSIEAMSYFPATLIAQRKGFHHHLTTNLLKHHLDSFGIMANRQKWTINVCSLKNPW